MHFAIDPKSLHAVNLDLNNKVNSLFVFTKATSTGAHKKTSPLFQ